MPNKFIDIPALNEKLLAGMQAGEASLNGNSNSLPHKLQHESMDKFLQTGFPSIKNEEWRFTPIENILKKISKVTFDVPSLPSTVKEFISSLEPVDAYTIVVVNGKPLSSSINTIDGVDLMNFSEAQHKIPEVLETHYGKYLSTEDEAFNAINTALSNDGIVLLVKKNVTLDKPVHIVSVHNNEEEGIFFQGRILVVLESGSAATITETHFSTASNFSLANVGAEIKVGENARVEYYLLEHLSSFTQTHASLIDNRKIVLEKNSFCNFITVTLSGELVRNNLEVRFDGTNGESHFYGLYLPSSGELFDNHTVVDHVKPNCFSNEFYKGIMSGNGKGVFNGKIMVRKDAQKTNAYQNNRNILLSDQAHVNTKPQLEIFADDVKCTHGATSGQLDEEALFYLRTRGISKSEATRILTTAFASDMLLQMKNEALRLQVEKWIEQKLSN